MRFIVTVKHFVRYDEEGNILYNSVRYDYDDEFLFGYNKDTQTLAIQGTSWKKKCTPEEIIDVISAYFKGTNYVIANVEKYLD